MCYSTIILLSVFIQLIIAHDRWDFNGTTPGLETIILGRCKDYQEISLQNRVPELTVDLNCTEVWESLASGFRYKDDCNITIEAYSKFINLVDNKKDITDKAMFWSGTKTIVHDFTHVNLDYETLEDTFPGYIADNVNWCGCVNCDGGINYELCTTKCDATKPFWSAVSTQFAERAAGNAYVMVTGTPTGNNTAYWKGSHFGKEELPILGKKGKVSKLTILVIFDVDTEPKEKCYEATIADLVLDAYRYGIADVDCIDNPEMVHSILCAKYPNANECKKGKKKKDRQGSWKDAGIALIVICLLLLVVIVLLIMYQRKRRKPSGDFEYSRNLEA